MFNWNKPKVCEQTLVLYAQLATWNNPNHSKSMKNRTPIRMNDKDQKLYLQTEWNEVMFSSKN